MDISITPINTAGLVRPTQPSIPAPAPTAPVQPVQQVASGLTAPAPKEKDEVAHDAAVVKALTSFENTYAISDKKFAIYKDASGQLITRYVSLRDGSVTYLPAPTYTRPIPPQLAIKA